MPGLSPDPPHTNSYNEAGFTTNQQNALGYSCLQSPKFPTEITTEIILQESSHPVVLSWPGHNQEGTLQELSLSNLTRSHGGQQTGVPVMTAGRVNRHGSSVQVMQLTEDDAPPSPGWGLNL